MYNIIMSLILIFSKKCVKCEKLLEYINEHKLQKYIKFICYEEQKNLVPNSVIVVPTLINTELQVPLEGKKAFEHIINLRYFYHPTNNNIYLSQGVPIPLIEKYDKSYEDPNEKYYNEKKQDLLNLDSLFNNIQTVKKEEPVKTLKDLKRLRNILSD